MFTRCLILLIAFASTFSIYAQEVEFHEFSVHKAQKEEYGNKKKILSKFAEDGSGIIPLQINNRKTLSKIVFGYLPDWEYADGAHNNQKYELLTHVATFDFPVSNTGTIGKPSGWPWTDVINAAHSAGTKVIMVVTNFDDDDIHQIITDAAAKERFMNSAKNLISTYKLDGINVDFEGLKKADKESVIGDFMAELTTYIHQEISSKTEVSFAGPAVNWGGAWNLDKLVKSCDYVFIMGYAFWGKWSSTAGPNAPLTGFTHTITTVLTNDYKIPLSKYPRKIILGVPYYGHEWKTLSGNAYSGVDKDNGGYQGSTYYRNDVDKADTYGLLWDGKSQTAWFRWQEGNQWHQTWFDDYLSLEKKYDLAIDKDIGGVGMWALGYDGTKQDLWNLINYKFGDATPPVPNKPKGFRVLQVNSNTLKLEFEPVQYADKYGIYKSDDGKNFTKITEVTTTSVPLSNFTEGKVYYFKVNAINPSGASATTEVLAAIPSNKKNILIVNGFDRISNTTNTFDYIRMYGTPMKTLGYSFSSASNEAVYKGEVDLMDFQIVFWMLMDESTVDETFNSLEQKKIKAFLNNRKTLVVSGSEIGWDLDHKGSASDKDFYHNYLKAKYIADAPNNEKATYYSVLDLSGSRYNFDNGTHGTINVDWPDAIEGLNGAANVFRYKGVSTSKGYAGIKFYPTSTFGGLANLGFPIETVYNDAERTKLIEKVLEGLIVDVAVDDENFVPEKFLLYQNYPNPFNPSTTIQYSIPSEINSATVTLKIYDMLGREIAMLVNKEQSSGNYKVVFNAALYGLTSGVYYYRLTAGNFTQVKKMMLVK
jgi:spore germination protein YaaH